VELRPRRTSLRCAYRADVPVPSPPCSGQENEHCSTAMEGIYTPTHGCLPAVLFRPAACDQLCFIRGQCEPERQPKKVGSHQHRLSSDIDSGIEVPIHKVHACGAAGGTHEYQDCENSCPQCRLVLCSLFVLFYRRSVRPALLHLDVLKCSTQRNLCTSYF